MHEARSVLLWQVFYLREDNLVWIVKRMLLWNLLRKLLHYLPKIILHSWESDHPFILPRWALISLHLPKNLLNLSQGLMVVKAIFESGWRQANTASFQAPLILNRLNNCFIKFFSFVSFLTDWFLEQIQVLQWIIPLRAKRVREIIEIRHKKISRTRIMKIFHKNDHHLNKI